LSSALRALVAAACWASVLAAAVAGAESPLDRVRSLVEEKRRLEWENDRLTKELAFASTPAPYIFVDLHARTIEFRVRGKAHKSYTASAIEVLGDAGRPLTESALYALAPKPIEVVEVAGGPPELKPPPASAPNPNASDFTGPDPNAGPVHSDAGILGVDAPTNYDVSLQGGVKFEIRTPKAPTRWEKLRDTFTEAGHALAETLRGWTGGATAGSKAIREAAVRVSLDEDSAKALYYSILPGEHVYFLPAPPPPVKLIASLTAAPQAAEPRKAR
jgi:hypothetical protein